MKLFDLAVKVEYLMMEMVGNLFWGSIMEFAIFMSLILVFVEDSSEMGGIWAFIPHLVRACIGYFILNGMPLTHEIIQTASFPANDKVDIDQVFQLLTRAARDALDHFTTRTKMFLHAYFGLTALCFIIDMFSFLVAFNKFGNHEDGSAYADVTLLVASFMYFIMDVYYIGWVISLEKRVPPYLSSSITKSAFGGLDSLYDALGTKLE